ncbi:leucyl aminopeptidase [Brevibacillus nitrificans]|uniref:leucyl aminopeptidase n=1 Tax=Brevibacillus nitrificans TaxID=651560 RepID=UPI00262E337C|nr:leucyl aminopeptidase [Brevibacillus nitrificans]
MAVNMTQLTKLFYDELVLCGVRQGEFVVVASQPESREGYVEAFLSAIESLGAYGVNLQFPGIRHAHLPYIGRKTQDIDMYIDSVPQAMETLKKADMVVDVTAEGLVHTKARAVTLGSGARMLMVWEKAEILERMFPRKSLRKRVETSMDMLRQASSMRVTTAAGTDITVQLTKETPLIGQYGYTDQPGRWDHFASGFVAFYPATPTVNGRVVLDAGDILLPLNRYVSSPIDITIEKGFITDIKGEGLDTLLFKQYFESHHDNNVYGTSHFGWGLDETALWEALNFYGNETYGMDARSFEGNFMWSTGPNAYEKRFTPCHYDIPMRGCTIELDGKEIIKEGKMIAPELKLS